MKFRAYVEPPEPMRGLEVPQAVVEALGDGKRPRVTITLNGHSWKQQGRHHAWPLPARPEQRQPSGRRVATGDEVEVELESDAEPPVVVEPADFARALDADPVARDCLRPPLLHAQARTRARHRECEEARDRAYDGSRTPSPCCVTRGRSGTVRLRARGLEQRRRPRVGDRIIRQIGHVGGEPQTSCPRCPSLSHRVVFVRQLP